MSLGELYRQSKQKKELNGEVKTQLDTIQAKQLTINDKIGDLQTKLSELLQSHDTLNLQFADYRAVHDAKLNEVNDVIIDMSKRMTSNGF